MKNHRMKSFKFLPEDYRALEQAKISLGIGNDTDVVRFLLRNATSMNHSPSNMVAFSSVLDAPIPTATELRPNLHEADAPLQSVSPAKVPVIEKEGLKIIDHTQFGKSKPPGTQGLDSFGLPKRRGNPHATEESYQNGEYPEETINLEE